MWALRLTLLLAIAYVCRGQNVFFDIGTQLQMNGGTNLGTSATSRRICFDGTNTYYTSGSQIFRVDSSTTSTAVINTGGPDVYSIACRCNILVYSYISGTGNTYVDYYDTDEKGITIEFDLGAVNQVAVELSPSHGLVIVGFNRIWIYDQAPLTTAAETFTYSVTTLDNLPRCVATYNNGGDRVVFVSFATNNNVQVITIPSGTASGNVATVTDREVRLGSFVAEVSCLDVDQGNGQIYFLVVADGQANTWSLDRYAISGWLTESQTTGATIVQSGSAGSIGSSNNGLVVCGTDCQTSCVTPACGCPTTGNLCGFCIGGDATCQCEDSGQAGCTYADATLAANCLVPEPHFDSYCIVDLPLAKRRKGGPIRVVGAAAASATITVSRLAQTGRWNTNTLPIRTVYNGNTAAVYWDGFEAAVPSLGRGRRFGVYEAYISPTDPNENPEGIPCIATENSGFYNQFYTYTRSIGDSVTLVATMRSNLLQFMGNVRWYFTGFNPTTGNPLSLASINCDGQLMCTITNLDVTDEGVYEAYRVNRRKRTWHPLFFLFVRECSAGSFGPSCVSTCPACDHGECDDLTGLCTCKAGWTGTLCDTPCTNAGEIGQTCGYTCGEIFGASTDCSGLSFCVPGRVGCDCYSGFEAPECMNACGAGFCGPSCDSLCNGGAATCDPRTCVP